jgi:hypothetical protein
MMPMKAVGIKNKQVSSKGICPKKPEDKRKVNHKVINTIPPPRGVGVVCDER